MTQQLTDEQIEAFRTIIKNRLSSLWQEIRSEMAERDEQKLSKLPGEIHDFEEASVSEIYAELNLALLEHHQKELSDLEAALKRIKAGSYGVCIECGDPVGLERLQANPAASRCISCQESFERSLTR